MSTTFAARCSLVPVALFVLAGLSAGGCVRYEYDIVRPPDLARHIREDRDLIIHRPPLEYRMRSVENYLVIRVFNPTPEPIRLLGDQSFVIDPYGQSHPLQGQTIAPGTYIKLIFPPPRPQVEPTGPTIGFGVGMGFGRAWGYGPGRWGYWGYDAYYDPYWDYPRYYTVYSGNAVYWNWTGQSDVRVSMVYQRPDQKPFTQDWLFHRQRM